jgi:hypothetical protein
MEACMRYRSALCAAALTLAMTVPVAKAHDESKYPNWKGQWRVILTPGVGGQNVKFDPTKAWGKAQGAPLTPEYQKIHEQSMEDQKNGGLGNYPSATCHPGGMPRMMSTGEFEYVFSSDTTYILTGGEDHTRRIFTDGRDWPETIAPTYAGYSIGKWIDEDGDGKYDVLEVETRGPFKGPRAYDGTGLPLHADNMSVFKERFYLDKADPNILHNMITVIDHALTRPWTVDKTYRRNTNPRPAWREFYCIEGNVNIVIGTENYFMSADGLLMPAKKDQAPPDLRYFPWVKK